MASRYQELSSGQFKRALEEIGSSLTEHQLHMLEAHYLAPSHRLTSAELAAAAGYPSFQPANSIYARLGKQLRKAMGETRRENEVYARVFVSFPEKEVSDEPWIFELRPAVVEALAELEWFSEPEFYGDSSDELKVALEGQFRLALRAHRNREQSLRRAKLRAVLQENGRLACEVDGCGFDFTEKYGKLGERFAEVHHNRPLSDGVRETTIKDLAVVCSNCHRMIHRGGACRDMQEISVAIRQTHSTCDPQLTVP